MAHIRQNVWELGDDWADPILWYARGVAAMKARSLADPTGWRFYAAIHGVHSQRWQFTGYLGPDDEIPGSELIRKFWVQCQHGSWYFLPWHRGYLLAFEATVRAAVVELGGPEDWALPYWNYFKPDQARLPRAFASRDWPDGADDNPLFVKQRYGPNNDGNVFVPLSAVNLLAMQEPEFTGVSSGGSTGFGGVDTGFSHGGQVHGGIESQPHDWVHGLVGGADPSDPDDPMLAGLMSDPATAALDPIFWLHHVNIDRLWEEWRRASVTPPHADPTEPAWVQGPGLIGQRTFAMPMPDGSTYDYVPADVIDLGLLGYEYDDPAPVPVPAEERRDRRARSPERGAEDMAEDAEVELIGASDESVRVRGTGARSAVRLDSGMRRKVVANRARERDLPAADAAAATTDRVFLNLENVRGQSDASAFNVYVGVPDGEDPTDHPDRLAGSVAPFGLRQASQLDEEHAGQGLTFVLDITSLVDQLGADDSFDVDSLPVRIVPLRELAGQAELSIGRISMFRQGR